MDMTILTDVGQRRTNNQDYANQYKNKAGKSMIFLADGMGGHRAGNIASENGSHRSGCCLGFF